MDYGKKFLRLVYFLKTKKKIKKNSIPSFFFFFIPSEVARHGGICYFWKLDNSQPIFIMQAAVYFAEKPPTIIAKTVHISLPRPGKHGITSKAIPAVILFSEELTKILVAARTYLQSRVYLFFSLFC